MKVVDRTVSLDNSPRIISDYKGAEIKLISDSKSVRTYGLSIAQIEKEQPLSIRWKFPAINVKGVWTSNALLDKRIRADWELPQVTSSVSVDAPVICAFGHKDENVITTSVSDVVNTIKFEAAIQEEDNYMHCSLTFFADDLIEGSDYSCKIRIDSSQELFSKSLQEAGKWLESEMSYTVMMVPEYAKVPTYSTWYSYHQNFTEADLLEECRMASKLAYKMIIVDDGWQTLDGKRGYDFTGDWEPERLRNAGEFVSDIHKIGLKVMFWYSVPFCGKKSKAYKRFAGKFLTEDHPWAPVFDPRFPEVRRHLIDRYLIALTEWKIDGFKLDFIDDFKVYPKTEMTSLNGRDTLSVNRGVELLISEIREALVSVKSDVLIEFRQKYISPMLRHLGNMFRAFDCPYDSVMNRVRTTDVKLLCGDSAVHSDMLTWNANENVEIAALQFTSIIFSVPQLSVKLEELPQDHLRMIEFYTNYWMLNRGVFLEGDFIPFKPLSNYPIIRSSMNAKCIYGIYEDISLELDYSFDEIDIINGNVGERIILEVSEFSPYKMKVVNCQGKLISESEIKLSKGIHSLSVPVSGIISLKKI